MKCVNEEAFINYLFKDLHTSNEVCFTALKSDNPNLKIRKYFERLDGIINRVKNNSRNREIAKVFFYNKYLCKELSERYLTIRKNILEKQLNDNDKKELLNDVRQSQRCSLDLWIDFLIDSNYPTWFKYYIMRGVLSSGRYDKSIDKITKRTSTSAFPFLEFNIVIIDKMYTYLSNLIGKEFDENELGSLNFKKLYIKFLKENKSISDEGIWIKYPKGSSVEKLVNDINGYNTGWCINQKDIAENYLSLGDFYIYAVKNMDGEYKIPKIVIRTFGNSIKEIRGVIDDQNLEKSMFPALEKKLEEFSYIESDVKKSIEHFKKISLIEDKVNNNEELSNEELCFLYEIGDTIECFGYSKEKRINEIKNKRNMVKDLNKIFEEVDCSDKCLFLEYIKDATGIKFPNHFYELDLSGLKDLSTLKLADNIDGSLVFNGLKNLSNYKFPREVSKTLEFKNLESTSNVIFPEKVGRHFNLYALNNFEKTIFPKEIQGTFNISKINYLENFVVPKSKSICIRSLANAKNVLFQNEVLGDVNLDSLKRAENIILPDVIHGELNLDSLVSAEEIVFPKYYVGRIEMKLIKNLNGLYFPYEIGKLLLPNLKIEDISFLIKESYINELYVDKYYNKNALDEYFNSKRLYK